MEYRLVEDYYRQEHFDFYTSYGSAFYSATVPFDITAVKQLSERRGHSIYLTLCYTFTRAAQAVEDLRYRVRDGRIVLYRELHPSLTVAVSDGRFSFAHLRYDPDPEAFFRAAEPVLERARRRVTLAESVHQNYLYFTALPAVPFTAFSHAQSGDPTDAAPRVAFGRFYRQRGRLFVPVGIQVSHVFIDGRALGELVEGVQTLFADPEGHGGPQTHPPSPGSEAGWPS
ncbi:MAG: CatA-like O-acetyltransferase [Thermoanaerobaculia bacterium]